jgi:hypothetical protein
MFSAFIPIYDLIDFRAYIEFTELANCALGAMLRRSVYQYHPTHHAMASPDLNHNRLGSQILINWVHYLHRRLRSLDNK